MSDEVIARKLIADGNGTNEDRRILNLFANLHVLEQNPDDCTVLEKIEIALKQTELAFEKQAMIADTCVRGADQIREFMTEIENDIAKFRLRIEKVKEELTAAKLVRKNKQEYDELAKLINDKPSRAESAINLAKVEEDIRNLHDQQKELEAKLSEKRKNLYALAVLLDDLEATEEQQPAAHEQSMEEDFDSDSESQQKQ